MGERWRSGSVSKLGRHTALLLGAFGGAAIVGCGGSDTMEGASVPVAPTGAQIDLGALRATIYRTSHGVAHIVAPDLASVSFGQGYALAEDHGCTLADQIVKVRSERARYLGADYLDSDFGYLAFGLYDRATAIIGSMPPKLVGMLSGYAEGYNKWLTVNAGRYPAACATAPWMKPISAIDLMAHYLDVSSAGLGQAFIGFAGNAQPPVVSSGSSGSSQGFTLPTFHKGEEKFGSNGWALGVDRTQSRRGMLLVNPHFPWVGELRLHETHLIVPGELDSYGVSLVGFAGHNIGFNENVAWTHTVSASTQATAYWLQVNPADPTQYFYEGRFEPMRTQKQTVSVMGKDGVSQVTRTLYSSHHGPVINIPGVGWTSNFAFSYRNADAEGTQMVEQFYGMMTAKNLKDFQEAHRATRGVPWANTMYTDKEGNALYLDSSRVPYLSPEGLKARTAFLNENPYAQQFDQSGITLLDGSNAVFDWKETDDVKGDHVTPLSAAPKVLRRDFIFNSNDSYWLTNPAVTFDFISPLYGAVNVPQNWRTRMSLRLLTGVDPKFYGPNDRLDREELKNAALGNQSYGAAILLDEMNRRCLTGVPARAIAKDVAEGCRALKGWDGTFNLDAKGAFVWREMVGHMPSSSIREAGPLFAEGFDVSRPYDTPRGLAAQVRDGGDALFIALADAVKALRSAKIPADAPLGQFQYTWKGDVKVPVHGGLETTEGVLNQQFYGNFLNSTLQPPMRRGNVINERTGLTDEGYVINFGSSFVMALEFTDDGPKADALLSYGQSADPTSPNFIEQTKLFSDKKWRPVLFNMQDVFLDPNMTKVEISQ